MAALFTKSLLINQGATFKKAWTWATGVPARIVAAAQPVDKQVSPFQIRLALSEFGLRDEVETAVAASDQTLQDWYQNASNFKRNDPLCVAMVSLIGVNVTQRDAL